VRRGARFLLGVLACLPAAAHAQSLQDRAYVWVQGDFRAPLVCIVDGAPRQALRRVRIHPAPRSGVPAARVTFHDLEAPAGTTCSGVAGEEEPNLIGSLDLVFDGRTQADTGEVDFRNALRRDGGFTFRIRAGRLKQGPANAPNGELVSVDYTGGTARVHEVVPNSDAARRLALFGAAERQLQLEVSADGARPLAFDLVELPAR
jgi:hypothetical protein